MDAAAQALLVNGVLFPRMYPYPSGLVSIIAVIGEEVTRDAHQRGMRLLSRGYRVTCKHCLLGFGFGDIPA